VKMEIACGSIKSFEPEGFRPEHAVGNGKLKLYDPFPRRHPLVTIEPDDRGNTVIEIRISD